ncbi:MAG: transcriptional regulator, partial [Microbacterium sp.]|nr:transcriptional regulator [Microbacterium sp.]
MTIAAPSTVRRSGRQVIETRPLRNPDAADPAFMGRRGWWLVVMNVLVPGSAQVLAGGNRRLGRIGLAATLLSWFLVLLAVVSALFWRSALISVATNWFVLTLLQVLFVAYALLWI